MGDVERPPPPPPPPLLLLPSPPLPLLLLPRDRRLEMPLLSLGLPVVSRAIVLGAELGLTPPLPTPLDRPAAALQPS